MQNTADPYGTRTELSPINKLTDELLFNMDNDMVTGLTFVDFRKAFNVTNHELLPKTLSIYGARREGASL